MTESRPPTSATYQHVPVWAHVVDLFLNPARPSRTRTNWRPPKSADRLAREGAHALCASADTCASSASRQELGFSLAQVLVDERDCHAPFADRCSDALYGSGPNVA